MTRLLTHRLSRQNGKEDAVPVQIETASEAEQSRSESQSSEDTEPDEATSQIDGVKGMSRRRIPWSRIIAYIVLPGFTLMLALAGGYLKWREGSERESVRAGIESTHAATDGTIAILSYRPETVEKDLDAARDRLSGNFKDAYTKLTHDVVIPGSRQQKISAVATVAAASSVSASESHAVALLFVNQTIVVGGDPPTNTSSRVRVTLDKVGGRWLIAAFDPI
jgi:Mce-associated membrane protein